MRTILKHTKRCAILFPLKQSYEDTICLLLMFWARYGNWTTNKLLVTRKVTQQYFRGFWPEWYICTIYHAWDTPFWSGTLNLVHQESVKSTDHDITIHCTWCATRMIQTYGATGDVEVGACLPSNTSVTNANADWNLGSDLNLLALICAIFWSSRPRSFSSNSFIDE